jgi:hypothetical protein
MALTKTSQLQIRIGPAQKRELQRRAAQAGLSLSAWALAQLLPNEQERFQELVQDLAQADTASQSFAFAALHDFLAKQPAPRLSEALAHPPRASLSPLALTYLAAMIEHALVKKNVPIPIWVHEVGPLDEPYFASELVSLRDYLLRCSPLAFKRRNLFVDFGEGRV